MGAGPPSCVRSATRRAASPSRAASYTALASCGAGLGVRGRSGRLCAAGQGEEGWCPGMRKRRSEWWARLVEIAGAVPERRGGLLVGVHGKSMEQRRGGVAKAGPVGVAEWAARE